MTLATLNVKDDMGNTLVFSLGYGDPAWTGKGREDAGDIALALSLEGSMRDYSPSQGRPGARLAQQGKRRLEEFGFDDVKLSMPEQPPATPGTVY